MADIEYGELSANFADLVVFDVRNRHELEEKGQILGSHCVPFVELESATEMDEDAFEAKYGLKKPTKTTPIITHCTKGGRARKAGDLLKSKGYNARVYAGSFNDWKSNGGSVLNPGKPYMPQN
ncbi:rhodanese domain-containing protein CG4456-like [Penaeus japonicus]|uniref:rhodanese domain-containing protein CG4456-like n=1 Tax=Penaeus japonicus TaxID=27405 RepID=UPI001C70EB3D|nr:rhodanese domain-containing protein CG4456-like [Penaeus japonicus]